MKKNRLYSVLVVIVKAICRVIYPTRCLGAENIPEGAAIVCATHSNYIDPILLALAFGGDDPIHFMGKKELFKIPVLNGIMRALGAFPVDRGSSDIASIRTAMRFLKDGEKVGIFPEGTRTNEDEETDAKTGAIRLASKMKVPVVPVYLTRKKIIFRKVDLFIGEPYYITGEKRGEFETLSQELMSRIYELRDAAK